MNLLLQRAPICNYEANAHISFAQASLRTWGGISCSWQRHPEMHGKGPTLFCALYVQPGADTYRHLHGVEVAFASVLLFLSSAHLVCVIWRFAFWHRSLLMQLDADTFRFAASSSDSWTIASVSGCTSISACSCRSSAIRPSVTVSAFRPAPRTPRTYSMGHCRAKDKAFNFPSPYRESDRVRTIPCLR